MPLYDRTGPRGRGPRTGRGAGRCPPMFGQELPPAPAPISYFPAERAPNARELALWGKAQKAGQRCNLLSYALKLTHANVLLTYQFARDRQIPLSDDGLAELESQTINLLSEIERLKDDMGSVSKLELGVRISANGNDLDIIEAPQTQLGWVIPAVIGAAIVIGIIARWAYLEKEVGTVKDQYNGVLRRADLELCKDPLSQQCADWKATKASGGYYKREGIIEKVQHAVKKIGGAASSALGSGLMLAIPLLLLFYLPRPKRS